MLNWPFCPLKRYCLGAPTKYLYLGKRTSSPVTSSAASLRYARTGTDGTESGFGVDFDIVVVVKAGLYPALLKNKLRINN